MKRMNFLFVLMLAGAALGEAYDPAKHGNPIVVTEGTADIDGSGAVIDGGGVARCATLGPNVTLRNFTFKNGFADWGGGVSGGRIVGCRIVNCTAALGGGAYGAELTRCTVAGCTATESGAALGGCTATDCEIVGNRRGASASKAAAQGGIVFESTLTDCALTGNTVEFGDQAPAFGGIGAYLDMTDCTTAENQVRASAGVCYGLEFYHSTSNGVYLAFADGEQSLTPVDPEPEEPLPDPSTYEPDVPLPFAPGEGMVGRYFPPAYLDQLNDSIDRVYDKKTSVKIEGLPTGLKLVKDSVGTGYDYAVEGVPTETLDGVTRRAYARITDAQKEVSYVPLTNLVVHPATIARFPPATNRVAYWQFPVAKVWPGYKGREAKWSFSGWPKGLKFSAETGIVSGTPTKVGRYTVKAVEKVDGTKYKNTYLATFVVLYEDGEEPPEDDDEPVVPARLLPDTPDWIREIRVGVACEWALSNTPSAKVTAKGLPSGLKLKSKKERDPLTGESTTTYSVSGVPTKAGQTLATFTSKLGGQTSKSTAAFDAVALPAWAQGTFDGGADSTFAEGGQATFSVSKVGKVSGKWQSQGTSWTLKAASYARYGREDGRYAADVVFKTGSGRNALQFTNELSVAEDDVCGGIATNALYLAYLNRWKTEPWKSIGKAVSKASAVTFAAKGFGAGDTITFKVAASGKVTLKGRFSNASVSGSAVLCPLTPPALDGSFEGVIFVYFPAKARTPIEDVGYSECVRVGWNGVSFVVLQDGP